MMSHYDEFGTQNAETIVFIHGAALSGWMWHHQVNDLQNDYHCLVPDLPAHGNNPQEEVFSIDRSVSAIADLITSKAHHGKAHLVGLSLGATIAIEIFDKHPDLVNRVMISAPPSGPFPGTSVMIALSHILMPLLKSDFVIRQTVKQIKLPDSDVPQFRKDQKAMRGDTFRQISREIHEHRLSTSLTSSDIAVLGVLGEHDNSINYRVVRDLVNLMHTAEGHIAPHVGHAWNSENPTLFNEVVRQWLSSQNIHEDLLPL